MDAIVINETKPFQNRLLKRRRWGRGWIIWIGNIFLKLSRSRIVMFSNVQVWQTWECNSYSLLYGERCERVGRYALLIPPFAGQSLRNYLETGRLTPVMFAATAQELRRAHALDDWSHGDLHLANVLYDGGHDGGRAWLIDFETRHETSLSASERHADDLLVLLLDLIGRDSTGHWPEWSRSLLITYGERPVLAALRQRLRMPKGLELILWKSRTNYLPDFILAEQIEMLKQILRSIGV